jgi:hypothetical protein
MKNSKFAIPVVRNVVEYAAIVVWWLMLLGLERSGWLSSTWQYVLVILGCWFKTGLFGAENLRQLFEAARSNLAHHRFLMLMGVNMTQMILSFAFDFHLLHSIYRGSFSGIAADVGQFEALFDFVYLSTLNFSFFGYSDILPQTVPAKLVNLTEIVLAFVTVIFLLSDFISLKESIRNDRA